MTDRLSHCVAGCVVLSTGVGCAALLCRCVQVDLFAYRRVFVPVHVHGNHWCLGCVDMAERRISYFDSLGGSNDAFFAAMRRYLSDEYAAHHSAASSCHQPPPLPLEQWTDSAPRHIPRQDNGSDCGVFTLKFADYLSHCPPPHTPPPPPQQQQHAQHTRSSAAAQRSGGQQQLLSGDEAQLDFSAADMEYFRSRIALEIKLQRVM